MTACVQSAAMFESELWWKGDQIQETIGRANEVQLLANQARATTYRPLPNNQPRCPRTQNSNSAAEK